MTIETKYNLGDWVYIISSGSLVKVQISEVKASANCRVEVLPFQGMHKSSIKLYPDESYQIIVYGWVGATTYYFNENECWPSPEEFVDNSKK